MRAARACAARSLCSDARPASLRRGCVWGAVDTMHDPHVLQQTSPQRGARLGAACVALACVLAVVVPAWALDPPEGWVSVKPRDGRDHAAVHTESLARMESWRVALPRAQHEAFRSRFDERMRRRGFAAQDTDTVDIAGTPARLARYAQEVRGEPFMMLVLEVSQGEALWHISALIPQADPAAARTLEADMITFAKAALAG